MPGLGFTTQAVIERLLAAGCVAAEEEADELMAAAPDHPTLERWIGRREQGEPLAWITGTVQFCNHTIHVEPGVYVPRFETEELARRGATVLAARGGRAADLCTGTGAIALHLTAEVPAAVVVGVDLDRRAVLCARRNGIRAVRGDLAQGLRSAAFDVVTAVAPYVPSGAMRFLPADVQRYEPRLALDGGPDGLYQLRRVVAAAARLLRPGGWLLVELGAEQADGLAPTLAACRFDGVTTWSDADGDLRGLAAVR